jgi:glyoxalase-like protein
MPHGLDHIVHAVRDLDAAADFYRRAGFMVGVRNRHPWGTHNRVVQLKNFYIEILEVAEPEKIVPHGARSFSFGAFNRDFLKSREGFSMLLLNSSHAAEDARRFQAAGIGNSDVFEFAREGTRPDGTVVKLAFSLAYAEDKGSPNVRFAVCQHHFPENFWNPAFQDHADGARGTIGVVLVADKPAGHGDFLKAFTGVRELQSMAAGMTAHTENGEIGIMEPAAFRNQFGISPGLIGEGMSLNALCFAIDDLDQAEEWHRRNGIASNRHQGRLVISPEVAHGATLVFEPAKHA